MNHNSSKFNILLEQLAVNLNRSASFQGVQAQLWFCLDSDLDFLCTSLHSWTLTSLSIFVRSWRMICLMSLWPSWPVAPPKPYIEWQWLSVQQHSSAESAFLKRWSSRASLDFFREVSAHQLSVSTLTGWANGCWFSLYCDLWNSTASTAKPCGPSGQPNVQALLVIWSIASPLFRHFLSNFVMFWIPATLYFNSLAWNPCRVMALFKLCLPTGWCSLDRCRLTCHDLLCFNMGMSENGVQTPNEIAIFHRDNDHYSNHWVFRGLANIFRQTHTVQPFNR